MATESTGDWRMRQSNDYGSALSLGILTLSSGQFQNRANSCFARNMSPDKVAVTSRSTRSAFSQTLTHKFMSDFFKYPDANSLPLLANNGLFTQRENMENPLLCRNKGSPYAWLMPRECSQYENTVWLIWDGRLNRLSLS